MQKVTVQEAIARLSAWLPPAPAQAVEFLDAALSAGHVLRLYQRFFPGPYRRSRASSAVPVLAASGETRLGYSEREWEFFALVGRRLFPLNLEWMQMVCLDEGEGRLEFITLDVPNPAIEDDGDGMGQYRLAVRVAAVLIGHWSAPPWAEVQAAAGVELPEPHVLSPEQRVDWRRFKARCRRLGGGMAGVPDLIDVVGHDSGNFWVDVDEEQLGYEQVTWSEKTVRTFAREWCRAQQIFRRQARAMDWLEERPARIARVVELWNACISQTEGGP